MRTVRKCTIRIFLGSAILFADFTIPILYIFHYFIPIKNFLCLTDVYCI